MRNKILYIFGLLLLGYIEINAQCTCVEGTGVFENSQLAFCENFETYSNGSTFPRNNPKWGLWPGTSSLASIQTSPGGAGGKSLYVQENGSTKPDLLLKLGNKSSERYRLSWQMYIPMNKKANYNLQHDEAANRWAFDVSFDANGIGTVTRLGKTIAQFPYLTGAWNKIVHIIDLDNDEMELWINDEFIDAWAFKYGNGSNFGYYDGVLGAINFYAGSNSAYYVDNICLWERGTIIGRPILEPICLKNGKTIHSEYVGKIVDLYTAKEYSTQGCRDVCDFGGLNANNAQTNNFIGVNQITKKSLLPNQILNLDCVKDAFVPESRKQLRGVVYSYVTNSTKIYPNLQVSSPFEKEDAYIVLYNCSTKSCIGMPANNAVFNVDKGQEYKIIVLAVKEIQFDVNIESYSCGKDICIVEPGVCSSPEDIPLNTLLRNLKMPNGSFTQQNRLFNTAKKDYSGYERSVRFSIKKETTVNIELKAQGLEYCIFLTGGLCSTNLLASSETLDNGGTAQISITLKKAGTYHILIDQLTPDPEHTFSLECKTIDSPSALRPPAESCPVLNESPHIVKIRASPLLLDGEALTLDDRIYLFNKNNNNREINGSNWNGREIQFMLKADANPSANKNCGYADGELIEFKIIRNNKIFHVKPRFQKENGNEITAENLFERDGQSLITGFVSEFNYDDFGIGNLPSVSSATTQFFVDVIHQKGWRFERFNNRPLSWIKIAPSSGRGITDVQFDISANTTTQSRTDTLLLINEEGFSRTIIITQPGCTGPSVDAGSDETICSNKAINLTAEGVGNISWRTSTGNTISGSRFNPIVTSTQTFTAISTLNGCTATDEVTITVSSSLNANAGLDQSICPGASATLTANGGGTYRWSTNQSSAQITVTPTQTTTYTVTVSQNGCEATDQVVVSVDQMVADAGANQSICVGKSTTLQASGGGTYRWSTNQTTFSINVSPASTQTYRVTVSNGVCSAEASVTVTVLAQPIANAGLDQSICPGASATLTASGGVAYRWSTNQSSAQITVTPTQTTTYTVTVSQNGCEATDQVVVNIGQMLANAGVNQSICAGSSTTLSANGGGTYHWSNNQTTASITVSPLSTQTYRVTVSNGGCSAEAAVTVTVLAQPIVNAGLDQSICPGASATLTASGGVAYRWSTNQSSAQITVTPTQTTTYTVTVSQNGCEATDQVVVNVGQMVVSAGVNQSICAGGSAILNASGGGTYRWSNNATTAQIQVTPSTSTTYTVTVTQGSCTNTASVTVQVTPKSLANAGPNKSICQGNFVALTGSGGDTYLWSTGATSANINVRPSTTQTYRVTVSLNGCQSTDSTIVTVHRKPVITLTDSRLIFGPTGYLKVDVHDGTPSYQYTWFRNDTAISNQKDLFGLKTGIYKLVVTDARGCSTTFGPTSVVVTSLADIALHQQVQIYPNPAAGLVHISGKFDDKKIIQIKILDTAGREMWKSETKLSTEFLYTPDLANLAKGIYIVQLNVSGDLVNRKLVIQ